MSEPTAWYERLRGYVSAYVIDEFTRVYGRLEALEAFAGPSAASGGLVWRCGACGNVEPVETEGYDVGDNEPCVHCDGGVAVVLDSSASGGRCLRCGGSGRDAHEINLVTCPACHGTGAAAPICPECKGLGHVNRIRGGRQCPSCHGTGAAAEPIDPRPKCIQCGERWTPMEGRDATQIPCLRCALRNARPLRAAAEPEKEDCEFGNGCVHADDLFKIIELLDGKQITLPTTYAGAKAIARVRQHLAGAAAEAEKAAPEAKPMRPCPLGLVDCPNCYAEANAEALKRAEPQPPAEGDAKSAWLPDLLNALGWQGGTIHDALREVQKLRLAESGTETERKLWAKVHDELKAERDQLRRDLRGFQAQDDRYAALLSSTPEEKEPAPLVGRVESYVARIRRGLARAEEYNALVKSQLRDEIDGHKLTRERHRHLVENFIPDLQCEKEMADAYVADLEKERDAARAALAHLRLQHDEAADSHADELGRACDERDAAEAKLAELDAAWTAEVFELKKNLTRAEDELAHAEEREGRLKEKLAAAEARLALADEVCLQVRKWAKYCEDNKFPMRGDFPMLYAIEAYEASALPEKLQARPEDSDK